MLAAPVPSLTDGVVTLRAHTEEDIEAYSEQARDPLVKAWTGVAAGLDVEASGFVVRELMPVGWLSDREWAFAVEVADSDGVPRYAGTVSLRRAEGPGGAPALGRAEIAYSSHPWARGSGYLERALRLLLAWGFSSAAAGGPELKTVIWWAYTGNWPSRKLAWRLGFSNPGTLAEWLPQGEVLRDTWVATLTSSDELRPRTRWLDPVRILGRDAVVLRAHRAADAVRIQQAAGDELTAYWLGHLPSPYDLVDAIAFVDSRPEEMATGKAVHWAIADETTDLLLGAISLMDLTGPSGPEIGYWLHPDARGRAVITEAVRLVVRHAFIAEEDGGLGLEKVRLIAAVENTASRRVAERNGFREVGIQRAGTRCRDGWHDAMIYDLLPTDLR